MLRLVNKSIHVQQNCTTKKLHLFTICVMWQCFSCFKDHFNRSDIPYIMTQSGSRCLVGPSAFSGVALCDGMRYNSAKNMTYIPNEGVDMHGDADPRASNSSNCNTMDIIITWDFDFFRGSCCPDTDYSHITFYCQKTDRKICFVSLQGCQRGQCQTEIHLLKYCT